MHARRVVGVRRNIRRLGAVSAIVSATLVVCAGVAYVQKVAPTPNPVALQEGDSQVVSLQLDAPIIAPGGGTPPTVIVTFTVDDPSRVSLSSASLTWTAATWFQVQDLTVTALHDGVHDASNTVVVHAIAASAAVYYNGFTTSFTVSIIDIDPAPTTTTTTTTVAPTSTVSTTTATSQPASTSTSTSMIDDPTTISPNRDAAELPKTGGESQVPIAVGALSIAFGAALTLGRRARAHR